MSLPKNEAMFSISIIGETTQEQYVGDFICVPIPTIGQRNVIAREEMRLIGDPLYAPADLQVRAIWLSALRVQITEGPTWWTESGYGHGLYDENVVKAIYDKLIEATESWREEVKKKAEARQAAVVS